MSHKHGHKHTHTCCISLKTNKRTVQSLTLAEQEACWSILACFIINYWNFLFEIQDKFCPIYNLSNVPFMLQYHWWVTIPDTTSSRNFDMMSETQAWKCYTFWEEEVSWVSVVKLHYYSPQMASVSNHIDQTVVSFLLIAQRLGPAGSPTTMRIAGHTSATAFLRIGFLWVFNGFVIT